MALTAVPISRPNDQTVIHHVREAQLSTEETHSMRMHGFRLRILNSGDTKRSKGPFLFLLFPALSASPLGGKGSSFILESAWTELLSAVSVISL